MDESQVYKTTLVVHQEIVSDALNDAHISFSVYESPVNAYTRGLRASPATGMGSHWLFFVSDDQLEKARQVIQGLDLPDERGTRDGFWPSVEPEPTRFGVMAFVAVIIALILIGFRLGWFTHVVH